MQLKENQLNLIKVENPFKPSDRSYIPFDFNGENLLQLKNSQFPEDVDVAISVNGKIFKNEELELYVPVHGDCIVMIARIQGGEGGGKSILRTLAFVAIMVVSVASGQLYLSSVAGATMFGATMVMAGVSILGGMLVNALLPPPKPEVPASSGLETSQSFSWNPATTQTQGGVIPLIYGTNKVYGNVIAAFLENVNDDSGKQYLNCIMAIGMGPLGSISDIYINDQPIETFNYNNETVTPYVRLGFLDQDPFPNFSKTPTYTSQLGYQVTETNPRTVTTDAGHLYFDSIEVDVTWPNGLYTANDQGGLSNTTFQYRVMVKPNITGGDWKPLTADIVTKVVSDGARWSKGYWLTTNNWSVGVLINNTSNSGWVEIEEGSAVYSDHTPGEFAGYYGVRELIWRWVPEEYFETVTTTTDSTAASDYGVCSISSNKTSSIRRTLVAMIDPAYSGYSFDIRVEAITANSTDSRTQNKFYLDSYRLMTHDKFTYPRIACVGLRALATDNLSGSIRFSCMTTGKFVRVYNGSSWSIEVSCNPAWIMYDVLTQPLFNDDLDTVIRYEGFDPSYLVTNDFLEWARFCDEAIGGIPE